MLLKALPWQVEASVGLPARLEEGGWFKTSLSEAQKHHHCDSLVTFTTTGLFFFFPTDNSDE